jgi:site-specific recombinase XerD
MTPITSYNAQKHTLHCIMSKHPFKEPILRIYDTLDKTWYIEYYAWDQTKEKLVRKRFSLNHPTKKERLQVGKEEAKNILELLQGGAVVNPKASSKIEFSKNSSLLQNLENCLQFTKKTLAKSSYDARRTHISRLLAYVKLNKLSEIRLSDFSHQHARAFVDDLSITTNISNRTRNNNKNELSTVFGFFLKRKLITENPFLEIENLPAPSRQHSAFSKIQLASFLDKSISDPQLQLFVQFIYYAFIRPRKELRLLKVKHILENTILINATDAKEDKAQHIMIPQPLEALIIKFNIRDCPAEYYVFGKNGYPGEEPTYYHQMYRRHKKILELLELQHQYIDLYSWKHTGVIALWKATQNIELIRKQCRHSDIQSTTVYLRDLGLFTDYEEINKFPPLI